MLAVAQQDDPSEIFLKAYLSAQQGEKLERQDRFKTALAKYRFAGSLIEELAQIARSVAASGCGISRAQNQRSDLETSGANHKANPT